MMSLSRKLAAEFLGTTGLLMVVVGSGIMAENLSGGNVAIVLLANSLATVGGLAFLIWSFIDISGAHFNPAVTLAEAIRGSISGVQGVCYFGVQVAGAFFGVALVHLMFELPVFAVATNIRGGGGQFLSEFLATFGLIAVIFCGVRFRPQKLALMVAFYIGAAYWFTSSTSFANPAVTLARAVTDSFTGIAPENVPLFILAQILGSVAAVIVFRWLLGSDVKQDD